LQSEKYYSLANTVNRLVENVKSCYSYYPLLYYNHRPVHGIRGRGIELLVSSNIALRFGDIEHKETYLLNLSRQKGGST
jgi:hypothetical protein